LQKQNHNIIKTTPVNSRNLFLYEIRKLYLLKKPNKFCYYSEVQNCRFSLKYLKLFFETVLLILNSLLAKAAPGVVWVRLFRIHSWYVTTVSRIGWLLK